MLLVVTTFGRLFTKTRKRSGPKIDPCGTPLVTGNSGDFFVSTFTRCIRLSRYFLTMSTVLFGIPVECRASRMRLWSSLSNFQKFWQNQCTPLQGILSESPGFCKFHLCTLRVARGWNASEQNRTDMGQLSEERFQQWFSRSFSPKVWICYRGVILVYISLPVIDPYL